MTLMVSNDCDLYLKAMFHGKVMDTFSHWIQRIRRIGKPWKEEHVMWPGVSFRIVVLSPTRKQNIKKRRKRWNYEEIRKIHRRQCMRNRACLLEIIIITTRRIINVVVCSIYIICSIYIYCLQKNRVNNHY